MSKKQLRRENALLLSALVQIEHTRGLTFRIASNGRIVAADGVPAGYQGPAMSDGRCQEIARKALVELATVRHRRNSSPIALEPDTETRGG